MKQFSDPIYKYIEVESYAKTIIDTPYFYRLRHLRQLGTVSFVYSAADQTRFQHSLGVYHLTRYSLDLLNYKLRIEERVPEQALKIVKIAALVHDIGHGPFSHLFDAVQAECKEYLQFPVLVHEEWSCKILYKILESQEMRERVGIAETDISSICSLIKGDIPVDPVFQKYQFLTEIVSNSVSGLDTDKMDYLARDSYAIGNGVTIEPLRIIQHQDLFFHNGKYYLSNSYKTRDNIELIYSSRKYMQKQIYRHPKVLAFDLLIKRIFKQALSENALDLNAYYLSANLILPDDRVLSGLCPRTDALRTLLEQLNYHHNPSVIFNYYFSADSLIAAFPPQDRMQQFTSYIAKCAYLPHEDFELFIADCNYGIKFNDPAKFILFHNKNNVYVPKEYEILYFNQALTPLYRKQFLLQTIDPRFKELQITVFCSRNADTRVLTALRNGIAYFLASYGALSCEAAMLLGSARNPQIFALRLDSPEYTAEDTTDR